MRRVASGLAVLVVSLAGVVGLLAFFESRDQSTTASGPAAVQADPGRPAPPATADPLYAPLAAGLRAGDVVLRYGRGTDDRALRAVAEAAGAGYGGGGALERSGQTLLPVYAPGQRGVVARAWRRSLRVATATDPRLQDFVEAWLGRGAGG